MAGDETETTSEIHSDDAKKKAELENQIRKRVASEERAFRIVESLVDTTVSFERLQDTAHFLLPAHYKDITEERAITKLCGFPVCKNPLGNVKKQKYQISTKTNRVYDITETKNFCSSKCYKLSKVFEKQILESPLWTRELEKPVEFLLPDTKTGWMGVQVISQTNPLENSEHINEAEENKAEDSSILDSRNWINDLQEKLLGEKPLVFNQEEDEAADNLDSAEANSVADYDENQGFSLGDLSDILEDPNMDDAVSDISERLSTMFDSDDDPDTTSEATPPTRQKKRSNCSQIDSLADALSEVNISKEENLKMLKNDSGNKMDYYKKLFNCQKRSLSFFIDHVPSSVCMEPPHASEDIAKNVQSQPVSASAVNLATPEIAPSAACESPKLESSQQKIQKRLHSWITQESLQYLGITKEEDSDTAEDANGNPEFAKLCDRLDLRGLEFDELLEERLPQTVNTPKKNLPSYEDLQKETAKFSVKVKEYYKPPPKKKEEKTSDVEKPVYVLPPVDSFSQITLRRSIVLQQLGKRIDSLLSPMDILIGEISTEINELVSTFNLQNETIVFKPAEWSAIGIFLILMLSKKLEKVDVALQATNVQDKFADILNLNFHEARQILENKILLI
ncbi:RPAP2 [Acanthosepion pharaonis]|uniref:RNA polymerase II subunit B1 CTD phosphatase RPAP2 homolog n=1 Tax=Acanthosepion pharaonis TaxID=158019 RepID=A0A812AJ42_ACAPH|nr:RPAP2 [Sepia pharaonis]